VATVHFSDFSKFQEQIEVYPVVFF
jgi:hypothetical protein